MQDINFYAVTARSGKRVFVSHQDSFVEPFGNTNQRQTAERMNAELTQSLALMAFGRATEPVTVIPVTLAKQPSANFRRFVSPVGKVTAARSIKSVLRDEFQQQRAIRRAEQTLRQYGHMHSDRVGFAVQEAVSHVLGA